MTAGADDYVTVLVCPACGEYEANEFLIANNHGINRDYLHKRADGTWATTGREYGRQWCVALELTSRHVAGEYNLTDRQNRMRDRFRPDIRNDSIKKSQTSRYALHTGPVDKPRHPGERPILRAAPPTDSWSE